MKQLLVLPALLLFTFMNAQTLQLVDSLQFVQAQIWGVNSDQGDSMCVTTTFTPATRPHIYLRKVDYANINAQSTPVQLTFDSDFTSLTNLTDHKHLILHNKLFVAFSTQGDQQLYLFKTDINGNRIGNIVPVTLGPGGPTNDMILTTDSTYIYVLHFAPPGQHHVYKYDQNLNFISGLTTTTNPHNNIGGAVLHNNAFHLFTGSTFGFNSSLTLTTWDTLWAPLATQNILPSVNGDGNWFATGIAHDPVSGCWIIAESHIEPPTSINNEHIDILLYDAAWNLIERIHATGAASFRPHFVFKNGFLYMTYDKQGGYVGLKRYYLLTGSVHENAGALDFSCYPNPAWDEVVLRLSSLEENVVAEFYDVCGRCVLSESHAGRTDVRMNVSALAPGVYTIRIISEQKTGERKVVISH